MNNPIHPWLQPLCFRNGSCLPDKILPGPMDGVSEGSFIQVMTEEKLVTSWFTPFIRISTGVPHHARIREKIAPYLTTGLPVIVQLMGTRNQLLAETARRFFQAGATCVDLNCACPSHTVVGSRSGGYLLQNPEGIADSLMAMKEACGNNPISVKIRCGFHSADEMPQIAQALQRARPDFITCHFRTVAEEYCPVPDGWKRLAHMRKLLPDIPLFGSGDIFTVADARRLYNECHLDGIAPARGLLKNPALLQQIRADCRGEIYTPENHMTEAQFLDALGAHSNRKKRIFVLKVAKVMYGEESQAFQKCLQELTQPS